MKPKRLILIFGILIVLFAVAYLILLRTPDNVSADTAAAAIPCPADPVVIDIAAAESFTLARIDNTWRLVQDENFPLDTVTCSTLYAALTDLTALRTVEGGDTASFGFDTPQCTMTVTDADETEYRYLLGNYNAYNDLYYFSANDVVFMIDSITAQYFLYNTLDFIIEDTIPEIDEADVTRFEVRSASSTWYYALTYTDGQYAASGTLVDISAPDTPCTLDAAAAMSMIRDFTMLYFFDCAAYNTNAESLAEFGLDTPFATVYLEYTAKTADGETVSIPFAMHFGSRTDDYIYVRMEDSDMVFTAYVNEVMQFLSPNFDSMKTE